MIPKSEKTVLFFRKALDAMFQAVGFKGFDAEFAARQDWYSRHEWTGQQKEDFRKWFVANSRKDLKWNRAVAEREFALFDLMWGWRDARRDSSKPTA